MHWYAAIVKRQKERLFCGFLADAGFEGYVPLDLRKKLVRRRPTLWEYRQAPVIRGLVFIGADANLATDAYAWQAVASLPFYKALVGNDGTPRTIHQREIDRMMEARAGKDDLHVGYRTAVPIGSQARIKVGSFEGLPALKVRELTGRRAVILLKLLGGEREIEVDDADLELWVA